MHLASGMQKAVIGTRRRTFVGRDQVSDCRPLQTPVPTLVDNQHFSTQRPTDSLGGHGDNNNQKEPVSESTLETDTLSVNQSLLRTDIFTGAAQKA